MRENIGCAVLSGRPVHDLLSIEHEGNEAAAPMMGIHLGDTPARYGVVRVKERSEAVRHPAWGAVRTHRCLPPSRWYKRLHRDVHGFLRGTRAPHARSPRSASSVLSLHAVLPC